MALLTMTPKMVTAIEEYLQMVKSGEEKDKSSDDNDDHVLGNEPSLENPAVGNPITHGQVIDIFTTIRRHRPNSKTDLQNERKSYSYQDIQLEQLLRGSKIYVPPPKSKSESEDNYKTLMYNLRRQEEEREYEKMISRPSTANTYQHQDRQISNSLLSPSPFPPTVDEESEMTYADVSRQMALILNIFISIVACGFAVWTVTRNWSTPQRLALSLGGCVLVAIAEVVVYAGYLGKLNEAKERGKDQIEAKEIVNTWVIGGEKVDKSMMDDSSTGNTDDGATEEKLDNSKVATLINESEAYGSHDPVLLENNLKENQRSSGVSRSGPLPTPRRGGM